MGLYHPGRPGSPSRSPEPCSCGQGGSGCLCLWDSESALRVAKGATRDCPDVLMMDTDLGAQTFYRIWVSQGPLCFQGAETAYAKVLRSGGTGE